MGSIATRLDKAEKALQGTAGPDTAAWLDQLSDQDLERLEWALQRIEDARAAGKEEPEDAVQIVMELLPCSGQIEADMASDTRSEADAAETTPSTA